MFFLFFYKSYKNLKFYVLCYGYLFHCPGSPKVKCSLNLELETVEKVLSRATHCWRHKVELLLREP